MRLKLNRNLQLGYGLSIVILVVIGIAAYAIVNNLLSSNREVGQSNLVMQKLEKTISIMKDAETGKRGFLLTSRRAFLEPYNGSYTHAIQLVDQVQALTADDPRQQADVRTIRAILIGRLRILKALIDKKQRGETVTLADLESGKSAMDALRQAVDHAEQEEQLLLDQRNAVLNRYARFTPPVIIIAVMFAVLIALFSYTSVLRDIREKDRLRVQLEIKEQETAAFNEELTAANEEINAANEELAATNEELAQAREELMGINELLEEKVQQRTLALTESEAETQALNEELTAINEEMAAAGEEMQATNEELVSSRDELQKSEKLFRSIAVNIPKSVIIIIGKDHRFLTIEGELMQRMGYDGRDYAGKHPAEVAPTERYEATKHLYDRVLAGETFRTERKSATGEDFQVDFVPLRDENGAVYAGLIIAIDMTENKQAEEKSAKLAAIVHSSNDAIISTTLDGIITSWNPAAERMFGYTEAEMTGQPVLKLIPEDRQAEEPQLVARLKSGEQVEHFETKRVAADGKVLDISLSISLIRNAKGDSIGLSKIARDISEKMQDEQRKNDFIGMASHELKTPLTSLTALLQVLGQKLRASEDPFIATATGKANLQVKKMSAMINGFLNVSRLESGKIVINQQVFDLQELIREVADETSLTVSSHQIILASGASFRVTADREKISSVISNLLSNAVKYSPKGKIVTIACAITGNEVTVSVKDEGMGIKPQDINKLFDRYYRVETDHTRHISGFGIGLYLSAEIISRHQGRIWAESQSGIGSTFYFTLPLA